jgi:hypothetical protein
MHEQTFIASLSFLNNVEILVFSSNVVIKDGKIEVDG